jgi:hypothetical protein
LAGSEISAETVGFYIRINLKVIPKEMNSERLGPKKTICGVGLIWRLKYKSLGK